MARLLLLLSNEPETSARPASEASARAAGCHKTDGAGDPHQPPAAFGIGSDAARSGCLEIRQRSWAMVLTAAGKMLPSTLFNL